MKTRKQIKYDLPNGEKILVGHKLYEKGILGQRFVGYSWNEKNYKIYQNAK